MLLQNPVDFSFQTQGKRRRQTQEMEWLGEEEYNPGVPVWRGEPQVRMRYFNALKSNDLDTHLESSEKSFNLPAAYENWLPCSSYSGGEFK